MLLGTVGASLLGNVLAGKGINRAGKDRGINRAVEGIVRAAYGRRPLNFCKNKKMDFQCPLILWQILIYKNMIKMNQDLMVNDIFEVAKSLEDSGLLLKGVSETVKKKAK